MGIVNTTPDSFSDGGALYRNGALDLEQAFAHARRLCEEGAAILDIGGESTRPGAAPVSLQQEQDRVLPLVERIAAELDVIISVDTSSAAVIRDAATLGAGLINDVRALGRDGALEAAAATGLPVCLMHMQGQPDTMQAEPLYADVVAEVRDFLTGRIAACVGAGIDRQRLLLDPGFGFGKTVAHNLQLLDRLPELALEGLPLLVGLSRKSLIGKVLARDAQGGPPQGGPPQGGPPQGGLPRDRLAASLALAVLAVERGAAIVRAHDVAATVDALAMCAAMREWGRH
ncbi:dihydropteroate synthase [Haliea sp. E1-2-M8]|uniref:dihydropteroate synthase n=1 Tax=Haliea sp. E1-2-M8 TaxID=3064706 RepID=UPI002718F99F|nr:dihydropteroate synthase [Haliea sp. E1-2-M8]MDO8861526.1 dihydropteroate synthase [Haliea sp. E1-2-M8]